MTSRFGDLIKKAREQEPSPPLTDKTEKALLPAKEEMVNLSVRVPLTLRRHWAAESKRQGISLTEVIIQSLTDRFGKPS